PVKRDEPFLSGTKPLFEFGERREEPDLFAAVGFTHEILQRVALRRPGGDIAQQRHAQAVVDEFLQYGAGRHAASELEEGGVEAVTGRAIIPASCSKAGAINRLTSFSSFNSGPASAKTTRRRSWICRTA
ncbi:hypothetical protein, partial [Serratia nevei]|uniref:hypothetical protein n=1 Tax=Serratia nevei TaxID=2703794 RepID=UPI004046E778